jgi:tripartite-type tricarboxylate transporter receptor subunit TctC
MKISVIAVCLALFAGSTNAQSYPDRPINMIIAYGAGGGTDLVARMITPFIEKYLGNNAKIVVQNKAGAGGGIGFAELARAPADGYTIGFINTPNLLTIPIERKSTFTWESFDLLGNLVDDPDAFAVLSSSPIKTLKDLADYARANPGKVTVGTTGVGSDDHLAMLKFERATGTKLLHVPFKGASDVRTNVAGGQIMVAAMNVGEVLMYAKAGTPLVLLGQMADKRSGLAPNVPTFNEQGLKVELFAWLGGTQRLA